jgi:hypothetical protein
MTEYITKEEAEKLAAELRIPILKNAAKGFVCSFEQFYEAINLAFEQRLEVVGYKNRFSGAIVTNIPSWAVESESNPLYVLKSSVATDFTEGKGDSK